MVLSFLVVAPYFHGAGIITNVDGTFHISRLQESYLSLKSGNLFGIFPDVMTQAFGKIGYPQNLFYPIFIVAPEAIIHVIIKNGYFSYYIFLMIINFCIFISMYLCSARISKSKFAGIVSALVYGFFQYKIHVMFYQGDLAESIVFIFLPIVVYGLYELLVKDYHKWWILSVGMALIMLTHVLSTFLASIMVLFSLGLLFFSHDDYKDKFKRLLFTILAGIIAILLSCAFLIPFIQDYKFAGKMNIGTALLYDNAMPIQNMVFNFLPNQGPGFGVGIGIIGALVIISSIFVWKKLSLFYKYVTFEAIVFLLLVSNFFPWQLVQTQLKFIQVPYRLLLLATVLIGLMSGQCILILCRKFSTNKKVIFVSGLTLFSLCISFASNEYVKMNPGSLVTYYISKNNDGMNTMANSQVFDYLPKTTKSIEPYLVKHSIRGINNDNKDMKQLRWYTSYDQIHYKLVAKKSFANITIPNIYYPGFHAYVNNKEVPIKVDKNKAINIPVQKGINNIDIVYKKTIIQIATLWISIIS